MASGLYTKGKQSLLDGTVNMEADTIKIALVANSYTANLSTDQYYSTISSAVQGTPQTLASKTFTDGAFDAADVTFTSLPGGATINALVVYEDTGVAGTSSLIAYIDSASAGLPTTPGAGASVAVTFDNGANKIFKL